MRKKHANERNTLTAWRKTSMQVFAACGLLFGAGMVQSCDKDILTGQPEWLGNSIYERLQEGIEVNDGSQKTFNTTLRLIDDLGYTETLSKTGSKTLFVTPDDVFAEWFAANGLTYEQMTTAQKKALFNNSMINNAYLLELMSNVSGNPPQEDLCMRRETASSTYDSIPTYRYADMPVSPLDGSVEKDAWKMVRDRGRDIKIFKDATSAPMIHFLPGFMAKNSITGSDLSIITNGVSTSIEDSWINGKKVISSEQTCKNGYIYVIDGVVDGTQSMAEIINNDPQMTRWASFLKRWSCPEAITGNALREYWTTFNTSDSVFNLRYFNSGSSHKLLDVPNSDITLLETDVLKFDPGWNQYIYKSQTKDMHYDAGAMIVPTDEALEAWWQNGAGKSLREEFGTWENIPYGTLAPLVNVNMLESFIESVPSKFSSVLDDGQKPLGITPDRIKKCYMGCNGVVYLVDEVYAPVKFRSVIAPALTRGSHSTAIIYNAISGIYPSTVSSSQMTQDPTSDFTPYLNAMDSRFSLIMPYNLTPSTANPTVKMFRYIDPCSYGLPQQNLFEFTFENEVIKGTSYKCTIDEYGNVTPITTSSKTLSPAVIKNRLYDIVDNGVIIGDITPDKQYYNTKGGSILRAFNANGGMNFQGGFQMDYGQNIKVEQSYIYDMGSTGNGVTYGVCPEGYDENFIGMPETSTKSVYQVLKEEAAKPDGKCKLFYSLLADDNTSSNFLTKIDGSYKCANNLENFNISLFDNYNYTVYVPTDDAIQALIDAGNLPTWTDYETAFNAGDDELAEKIATRIHDFIRYHVQDRAVCINGGNVDNEQYESAKLNPKNNRYYSFTVTADANSYSVTDQLGNTRNVITNGGFYNKICREYWIKGTPGSETATLESSSNAVVHLIDGVLLFDKSQKKTKWRD